MDAAVLDRVRKLLALAGSPNVHEAAAAAARASRLIALHRLEGLLGGAPEADPIADDRDAPLEVARRLRKWKVALAAALAEAHGCFAYTLDRGADRAIVLVGRSGDREAVRTLWDALVKRIEWLSATVGPGRPRDWHDAFRIGAVDTIARRLAEADAEPLAEGEALVRLDAAAEAHRAALEAFVAQRLRLGRGRAIRVRADGYEAGRRSARELPLPPGGLRREPG